MINPLSRAFNLFLGFFSALPLWFTSFFFWLCFCLFLGVIVRLFIKS